MSDASGRAPAAGGKLNLVVNVAILATLAVVLLQVSLGRRLTAIIDDWQADRTLAEVWPDLAQGSSRLAGSTVQPTRTVVEFIDYECPYCRRGAARVLDAVALDEVDVVIRHLPLEMIHSGARSAAEAVICSVRHGVFAEAHARLLMEDDWLEHADWDAWAIALGIDNTEGFSRCLQDGETARLIEADMRLAAQLGVTGTPGFVTAQGVFPGNFEGAIISLPDEVIGDAIATGRLLR